MSCSSPTAVCSWYSRKRRRVETDQSSSGHSTAPLARGRMADDDPRHPADRHGRLLRLGGAGPPPRACRPSRHRRRLGCKPRCGEHRLLRGSRLRCAHGHAHRPGPASLPPGRLSAGRHEGLRCGQQAAAGDPRALHRLSRAGLDRRGLPRCHRLWSPLRLTAGDRPPDPGARRRRAWPLLFDRHRSHQAACQAGRRARQARRSYDSQQR